MSTLRNERSRLEGPTHVLLHQICKFQFNISINPMEVTLVTHIYILSNDSSDINYRSIFQKILGWIGSDRDLGSHYLYI